MHEGIIDIETRATLPDSQQYMLSPYRQLADRCSGDVCTSEPKSRANQLAYHA